MAIGYLVAQYFNEDVIQESGSSLNFKKKNIYSRADGNGVTEDSNKTRRMDIKKMKKQIEEK